MRKHIIGIVCVVLLCFLLPGCSTDQGTNENRYSSLAPDASDTGNTIVNTQTLSVFDTKVDNDSISGFGGSDPILPENKYRAVEKWLNSTDTDNEVLWLMMLSPNGKDIYLVSHGSDDSQRTIYWIYYVDTDVLIKDDWSDGGLFSEQTAQSNKYLEDYVHKGIIVPYLENGSLKDSVKEELDSIFEEKPQQGDFGVIKAYDNYFVIFGSLHLINSPSKYVLIYYSWDFRLLGTEMRIDNEYNDILNDLRKQ